MTVEILVTRRGQTLVPHDELSAELIEEKFKSGVAMVTVQKKRSLLHNRLYWSCLRCIAQGIDQKERDLHNATKIKCGLAVVAKLGDEFIVLPNSTAFDNLDQDGFNLFFDKAINWWRECGLYNWIKPELREKLERGER